MTDNTWLEPQEATLVILDGLTTWASPENVLKIQTEKGQLIIVRLPDGCTGGLQMLDRSVFHDFKGRITNRNSTFLANPLYMFWRNILGETCTEDW